MEPDLWRPSAPPPDGGQNYGGDASSFKQQQRDDMEADLWQPPPPPQSKQNYRDEPPPINYFKLCQQLRTRWKIDVPNCLPSEFRKKTPFSLTLLAKLSQLAGLTQQDPPQGHELLKLRWRLRQEEQSSQASTDEWVTTRREYRRRKGNRVEEIRENKMGLMIKDVEGAVEDVKELRRRLRGSAGDKNLPTTKARHLAKVERTREAVADALRRTRGRVDIAKNRGVNEVDGALGGFDLSRGPSNMGNHRRQAKLAQRMANKKEGNAKLPLDSLQLGTLPVRSSAEVDTDRMMSSMAGLSHTGADPRSFEFRTNQWNGIIQDESGDDSEMEEDDE
ncbi:hypothetical protein PRZ48_004738 [Zasmidium cellare]|uniref:Uncharacterized protein n=1 Tax=Zasmidium cellare TaxID=395010 RepID=A0ABR0ERK1_ZASCE|nr:hypothetical protein PRZ48_004738 [Zasmidium cellare]